MLIAMVICNAVGSCEPNCYIYRVMVVNKVMLIMLIYVLLPVEIAYSVLFILGIGGFSVVYHTVSFFHALVAEVLLFYAFSCGLCAQDFVL
jgi:hypothetical protein